MPGLPIDRQRGFTGHRHPSFGLALGCHPAAVLPALLPESAVCEGGGLAARPVTMTRLAIEADKVKARLIVE